ncbi:hypothetical protein [Agromyces laixinhei]|uniref:hypothetical protein n=1 Tax=Agromyces laixinhei TaxID=2585717 RepID=UPI001116C110|nr:hypothetical protein [Agromyces laixinhei]
MIGIPRGKHLPALEAADAFFHSFGKQFDVYLSIERSRALDVQFDDAHRLVMFSRVPDMIRGWREETGLSGARGPKPSIDEVALLILMLIQIRRNGDFVWSELDKTLIALSDEQRSRLGVRNDVDGWYHRIRRCYRRLETMIDAFPGPRRKVPTAKQYRRILRQRENNAAELSIRAGRFHQLIEALLEASIQLVPREIRRRWKGNTTQDATKVLMLGARGNPVVHDLASDRTPINYDAGAYSRKGKHKGDKDKAKGKKTDHAIEAEIAAMVRNAPGEKADFPRLILGYDFHRPGEIKGAAKKMIESIVGRGHASGHFITDRAYMPYGAKELFRTLFQHGYEPVFDLKKNDLGKKDAVPASRKSSLPHEQIASLNAHLIVVGGSPYLSFMPEALVNAQHTYVKTLEAIRADTKLTPEQRAHLRAEAKALRDERFLEREVYRLTRRGSRRPDGSQQYNYPDPAGYGLAYDERTGEIIEPPRQKTIVIPFEVEAKWMQKYPHKSPQWREMYGLRNAIESINKMIKGGTSEDTLVATKRAPRGNTFSALVVGLACVSVNLRKILSFYRKRLTKRLLTSQNRLHRSTYLTIDQIRQLRAMYPKWSPLTPPPPKAE